MARGVKESYQSKKWVRKSFTKVQKLMLNLGKLSTKVFCKKGQSQNVTYEYEKEGRWLKGGQRGICFLDEIQICRIQCDGQVKSEIIWWWWWHGILVKIKSSNTVVWINSKKRYSNNRVFVTTIIRILLSFLHAQLWLLWFILTALLFWEYLDVNVWV